MLLLDADPPFCELCLLRIRRSCCTSCVRLHKRDTRITPGRGGGWGRTSTGVNGGGAANEGEECRPVKCVVPWRSPSPPARGARELSTQAARKRLTDRRVSLAYL